MRRITLCLTTAIVLSACAEAPRTTPFSRLPATYLVTVDQLPSPGFTAIEPAHSADAGTFASGNAALAQSLTQSGLNSAAMVRYFRNDGAFALSNGPVDVTTSVARFDSSDGAHGYFTASTAAADRALGAASTSTGPLGDEAHATTTVAAMAGGMSAVQYVIEWRSANLFNVVIARGRSGGARLDDALYVARQQAANER